MLDTTQNPPRQTLPNGTFFDMIHVEAGTFMMGSKDYDDSKPVHKVSIPAFYIGKVPVTQALWKEVMGDNPACFSGDKRPVEQVSWYDAAVFCNALNELCGYEPSYFSDAQLTKPYGKTGNAFALPIKPPVFQKTKAKGYRLPTEAEWEFAAIGGNKTGNYTYSGGENLPELGWFSENSYNKTMPVGLKMYNELGIHDMSGNVWEWCEDQYHDNYNGAPTEGAAWVDKEQGTNRVLRGGSWLNEAAHCRPTYRLSTAPMYRNRDIGFRLVLSSLSV